YSSLKFAMFSLGEFVEVVLLACVFTALFLGGWQVPWLRADGFHFPNEWIGAAIAGVLVLAGVTGLLGAMSRKSGLLAVVVLPLLLLGLLLLWGVNAASPTLVVPLPYWSAQVLRVGAMITKVLGLCWFQLMIRWTLPRFRYDQLMKLGWVVFFELALFNIFLAALIIAAPHIGILNTLLFGFPSLTIIAALMFFITKANEEKRRIKIT
ncbi:MAG: NADH-quinone oxidoreductase subunit H, partial [Roseibacillus sp.]|nr:NADH-quinone oxidoreductase subunit H [Roseibacillus sp.]